MPSTPARLAVCEVAMFEPILGLAAAVFLGIYLVLTLIRPERF
ncbi:K(+)-transporting ATPase subunit F [Rhizobium oryzicola]|uniref:K(+)-transporting ATPase subunit F n=1 Tax=Rhizobium oryzicola TaxID=1232668 RepID=A0ABT8T3C1_9HYPH|nr:K(+)-transporting ATPase subunit F [Rhizobium oryzicola]MDO1584929.1 K(+)-transporting ATPase subunit F [Rhizobium oryzicola]